MDRKEVQIKLNVTTCLIQQWEDILQRHPAWQADCVPPPPIHLVQHMLDYAYYLIILLTFKQYAMAEVYEQAVRKMAMVLAKHHTILTNVLSITEDTVSLEGFMMEMDRKVKEIEKTESYQTFQKAFLEVKETHVNIMDALEKKGLPSIRQMEGIQTVDDFLKQI